MKVLLLGLGKMGSLHGKYLDELNIDWCWFDPDTVRTLNDSLSKKRLDVFSHNSLQSFTHFIIATPTHTHEDLLYILLKLNKKILVEKPGVINQRSLHFLENKNVSVGMVERFNPAFQTVSKNIEKSKILNIDFIRCSARPVSRIDTNSFIDVGIHDLDLMCQIYSLSDIKDIKTFRKNNTFTLTAQTNNEQIIRFIWSNETYHKERRVCIRQLDYNLECNLADQTVKKFYITEDFKNIVEDLYVEKKSPLLSELQYFLSANEHINAVDSHSIFLKILSENFN
jgi:predicted dehydrogenase